MPFKNSISDVDIYQWHPLRLSLTLRQRYHQYCTVLLFYIHIVQCIVVDRHGVNADPDPNLDTTLFYDADQIRILPIRNFFSSFFYSQQCQFTLLYLYLSHQRHRLQATHHRRWKYRKKALITYCYLKDAAMNAQSLASWLPGWRLASLLLQNSTRFPLSRLVSSFTAPTTPPVSGGNQGWGSGSGLDPDSIGSVDWIQSGQWIRNWIWNPDPDPGRQKWPTKVEKN